MLSFRYDFDHLWNLVEPIRCDRTKLGILIWTISWKAHLPFTNSALCSSTSAVQISATQTIYLYSAVQMISFRSSTCVWNENFPRALRAVDGDINTPHVFQQRQQVRGRKSRYYRSTAHLSEQICRFCWYSCSSRHRTRNGSISIQALCRTEAS